MSHSTKTPMIQTMALFDQELLQKINAFAKSVSQSRASLIRKAVEAYLARQLSLSEQAEKAVDCLLGGDK